MAKEPRQVQRMREAKITNGETLVGSLFLLTFSGRNIANVKMALGLTEVCVGPVSN
jgi:hypothetical protein